MFLSKFFGGNPCLVLVNQSISPSAFRLILNTHLVSMARWLHEILAVKIHRESALEKAQLGLLCANAFGQSRLWLPESLMALTSHRLVPCWHLHATTLCAQLVGGSIVKFSHLCCHFFHPLYAQSCRDNIRRWRGTGSALTSILTVIYAVSDLDIHVVELGNDSFHLVIWVS